jgi:predicted RNA-binding Zn-ribbon protein involved in translation (DUF1610 family)
MRRSHHKPDPAPIPISFPCPHCGDRMTLRLVEPSIPDHDERTFRCLDCGFEEKLIVRLR